MEQWPWTSGINVIDHEWGIHCSMVSEFFKPKVWFLNLFQKHYYMKFENYEKKQQFTFKTMCTFSTGIFLKNPPIFWAGRKYFFISLLVGIYQILDTLTSLPQIHRGLYSLLDLTFFWTIIYTFDRHLLVFSFTNAFWIVRHILLNFTMTILNRHF